MSATGVENGPAAAGPPAGSSLLCRIGGRSLAVPIADVIETMRPLPIEAFPGVPSFVLGVSLIRGAVVPVLDVSALLGESRSRPGRFVTVRQEDRTVALAVDAVAGVRTLDPGSLENVPPLLDDLHSEAVSALGRLDGGLLVVLGQARLVPDQLWAGLDERMVSS